MEHAYERSIRCRASGCGLEVGVAQAQGSARCRSGGSLAEFHTLTGIGI